MNAISMVEKTQATIPEGAEIIQKSVNICVEQIENGYLLAKNYDIEYQLGKEKNYCYYSKKWFFKENPVKLAATPEKKETYLSDEL